MTFARRFAAAIAGHAAPALVVLGLVCEGGPAWADYTIQVGTYYTADTETTGGNTVVCTPSGPGPCGADAGFLPNGQPYSAFARVDLGAGTLRSEVLNAGYAWSYAVLSFGPLSIPGGPTPGVPLDAIVHVDYGWNVNEPPGTNASGRLAVVGQSGLGPYTHVNFSTGYVHSDVNTSATFVIPTAWFDDHQFSVTLELTASTEGGSSNAWLNFWVELPEGAALTRNVGGVPLSDPSLASTAVPAPSGLMVLPVVLAAFAAMRRRTGRPAPC